MTEDDEIAKARRDRLSSAFDPLSLLKTAIAAYKSYDAPPENGLSDVERFKLGSGMADNVPGIDLSDSALQGIKDQYQTQLAEGVMNSMGPVAGTVRMTPTGKLLGTASADSIASKGADLLKQDLQEQAISHGLVDNYGQARRSLEKPDIPVDWQTPASQHADEILEKMSEGGSSRLTSPQLADIELRIDQINREKNPTPEMQAELDRYIKVLDASHKETLADELSKKKEAAGISAVLPGEGEGSGVSEADLQGLEKPKSSYDISREKAEINAKKKQKTILNQIEKSAKATLDAKTLEEANSAYGRSYDSSVAGMIQKLNRMKIRPDRSDPRYKEVQELAKKAYAYKVNLDRGQRWSNIEGVIPGGGEGSGVANARLRLKAIDEK